MSSNSLYIGYTCEGNTDNRFLHDVIYNTFVDAIFSCCKCDIEINDITRILPTVEKREGFVAEMISAIETRGNVAWFDILCIHSDADRHTIKQVQEYKFNDLYSDLSKRADDKYCKIITEVIPVRMIESWMLADKELFKREIGAQGIRDSDLGISGDPESMSNPKEVIESAIEFMNKNRSKKLSRYLTISDLYYSIGAKIELDKLRTLESFNHFEDSVKGALERLGYI